MDNRDYQLILSRREEIRARIQMEGRSSYEMPDACRPADLTEWLLTYLIHLYLALMQVINLPPTPDQMLQLGRAGELINVICCKPGGMWAAFRRVVAKRHPDVPFPTPPLAEDGTVLASVYELIVYRALHRLPSVIKIEPQPILNCGGMCGDFRIIGATGLSVIVEVALVGSDPETDTGMRRDYRQRLQRKIALCRTTLGSEPVVIWSDQVASPRLLARRLNEVAARLHLDPLPLPAPLWFEDSAAGEAA